MGTHSNSLDEVVLTSTHNLCFRAKIRKIGKPLHTPVSLYKSGFKGVFIARTCFPDATPEMMIRNKSSLYSVRNKQLPNCPPRVDIARGKLIDL